MPEWLLPLLSAIGVGAAGGAGYWLKWASQRWAQTKEQTELAMKQRREEIEISERLAKGVAADIRAQEAANASLVTALSKVLADAMAHQQQELAALRSEVISLRQRVTALETELGDCQRERREAIDARDRLDETVRGLKDTIADKERRCRCMSAKLAEEGRGPTGCPSDLTLAKLSRAAYAPPEQAADAARELGFPVTRFIDPAGSTEAYVFANDRTAVVAVRGTDPNLLEDLLADARCRREPCEIGGEVHRGFRQEADRLDPELRAVLASLDSPRNIYYDGHSLGAGVATIAGARHGMRLGKHDERPKLVTFGCPRVGDHVFSRVAEGYFSAARRYVCGEDLITRVPLRSWGFDHCGRVHYLADGDEGAAGWERFLNRVPGGAAAIARLRQLPDLCDHGMEQYIASLERAEQRRVA